MKIFKSAQIAAGVAATALVLSACGGSAAPEASGSPAQAGPVTIGIAQYVSHPSLDAVVTGFKKGMADAGYTGDDKVTYDFANAQADQATNTSIVGKFASDQDMDLVLAIATPTAQAAASVVSATPARDHRTPRRGSPENQGAVRAPAR